MPNSKSIYFLALEHARDNDFCRSITTSFAFLHTTGRAFIHFDVAIAYFCVDV